MGMTIGWSGPAIPYLQKSPNEDGFNITDSEASWIGSLLPLGALFGGPLVGFLMSKFGKKGAMFMIAAVYALSFLLLVVAQNIATIYVGRILGGVATGMTSLVCPVYVAEVARPEVRGLLGSGVQVMVTIGILMGLCIGAVLTWRITSVTCLVVVLIWSFLLLTIPESPMQHLANKKRRDARKSLEWLRSTVNIDSEFDQIQREFEESMATPSKFTDLLERQNLAPLIISMYIMFGTQMCGVSPVIFFVVEIFDAAGSSIQPNVESIIVGVMMVGSTILGALVMDKLGRRVLLLCSASLMVISLSILGTFFYIKQNLDNSELATKIEAIPIVSLSVFVFGFSIGFGPIPWLMMSELFSPKVRSMASSLVTFFNWTLAFCVTKFFGVMVTAISEAGSFWVFGGITFITFLFCLLFVPETKGKTLENIQDTFRSSRPYFLNIGIWKYLSRKETL